MKRNDMRRSLLMVSMVMGLVGIQAAEATDNPDGTESSQLNMPSGPAVVAQQENGEASVEFAEIETAQENEQDEQVGPDEQDEQAQEDNTPTPSLRITVTAEKTPEDSQDVPASLTVLTQEILEDAQVDSLQSISQYAPNVLVLPSAPGNLGSYSVRGLGNSNFLSRDAVGFYIDDIPYDPGLFVDLFLTDLERVEVLRGPQNTLYGRSSSAGVVNIITRPPSDELEVRSAVSYGSFDHLNVQLSLSDTIIPDQLSFRLAGAYTSRDGMINNVISGEDVGDRREGTGIAQLLWTPSPDWEIAFVGTFSASDNDGFINHTAPFETDQDEIGFLRLGSNGQALKITYEQDQFRVRSITTRRFSDFDRQLDADGTAASLIRFPLNTETTIWSQEFRIESIDTERLRWLLGGYYESRVFDYQGGFDYTALGAALFLLPGAGLDSNISNLNQDTHAVFGQVDYQPIESLTLTAGLRYESTTTRLDRTRRYELAAGGSLPNGLNVSGAERGDSAWLPRFAVQYQINPDVAVYASLSRGYRPGGLNYTTDFPNALEFEAETSWNYELGVKSIWLDNRLAANLSLFTNQVDDYQTLVFDGLFTNSTTVNAEVRITGLEAELRATPIDGLDLTAGFGYISGEFVNYTNPLTGQQFDGNRLPFSPEFTYNLAAQYRSPGGIFSRVELQGFGTYFFDEANQFSQAPFALVNARLGYEGDNYGVYLFANNLFDTEYLTTQFAGLGNTLSSYGDRRTIGLQVRARF